MPKPITCKREGDEVVVRIPADHPFPVVAFVASNGAVSGGWVIIRGATSEIPRELRNLLSTAPEPVDRLCVDRFQPEYGARSPETATTDCSPSTTSSPPQPGAGHLGATSRRDISLSASVCP